MAVTKVTKEKETKVTKDKATKPVKENKVAKGTKTVKEKADKTAKQETKKVDKKAVEKEQDKKVKDKKPATKKSTTSKAKPAEEVKPVSEVKPAKAKTSKAKDNKEDKPKAASSAKGKKATKPAEKKEDFLEEGHILNPLIENFVEAEIDTAKGTFLSCLLPLAPSASGEVFYLKEVLPKQVTIEDGALLIQTVELLSKISPEDIIGLYASADLAEEFEFDVKSKQASILNIHTTLSSQAERDKVYCMYAGMLFEINYGAFIAETEKPGQIIPMTYCLAPNEKQEIVTYLIEPSRGYLIEAQNNSGNLASSNNFALSYVGYPACLNLMVKSFAFRLAMKTEGLDYFESLAPIHQFIEFYEKHAVKATTSNVTSFDKRKKKKK